MNEHQQTKFCIKCKRTKTVDAFHLDKRRSDGRSPYCKECRIPISNNYHKKNAEKIRENVRQWVKNNPEKRAAQVAKYAKKHPEQIRAKQHRRRSRKRNNGEFLILEKEYKKLYSSPCVMCGSCENISADHIIPLIRGGRHSVGNLQPLCLSCNKRKRTKLMIEFKRDFL